MLHPLFSIGVASRLPMLIAANDPVGLIPDLLPVIRDSERNRSQNQRKRQKKRPEPIPPPPAEQNNPDTPRHVDDYA